MWSALFPFPGFLAEVEPDFSRGRDHSETQLLGSGQSLKFQVSSTAHPELTTPFPFRMLPPVTKMTVYLKQMLT